MALVPVRVPSLVEMQSLQGSQRRARFLTPMTSASLLPAGDKKVVPLFDVATAAVLTVGVALLVIRQELLTAVQRRTELVEFGHVPGLGAIAL